MVSTGDLISAVENVSVYTRQEREEWVKKIKKGDKEAIEKAKKLYESRERAKKAYEKEAKEIVKRHRSRHGSSIKYVGGRFVDDKGNIYYYDKTKGKFIKTNSSFRDIQATMALSKGSTAFSEQREVLKNEAEYNEYLANVALRNINKSEELLKKELEKIKGSKYKSFLVNGKVVSKSEALEMLKNELENVKATKSKIMEMKRENRKILLSNLAVVSSNEKNFENYISDYRSYLSSQKISLPVKQNITRQYTYEDAYNEASRIYDASLGARISSHLGAAYMDLNMFSKNAFEYEGAVLAKYAKYAPINLPATLLSKALFPDAYKKYEEFERKFFKEPSEIAKERLAEMIYVRRTQGMEGLKSYKNKAILGTTATIAIPISLGYGSAAMSARFAGSSLSHIVARTAIPGISKGLGAVYVASTAYEGYKGFKEKDLTKFVGNIASIPVFVGLGKLGAKAYGDAFSRYVSKLKTPNKPVKGRVIIDTNVAKKTTLVKDEGLKLIGEGKEALLNQRDVIGRYVLKYEMPKKIRVTAHDEGYSLKVEKPLKSDVLYSKVIKGNRVVTEVIRGRSYKAYVRDINSGKLLYSMKGSISTAPIATSKGKGMYARYEVFEKMPNRIIKEYEMINNRIRLKGIEIGRVNKVSKVSKGEPSRLYVKEVWDHAKGLVKVSKLEQVKGYYKEDFAKLLNKQADIVISPREIGLKAPKGKLRGSLGKASIKLDTEIVKISYKDLMPKTSLEFKVDAGKLISPLGRMSVESYLFGMGRELKGLERVKNMSEFKLNLKSISKQEPKFEFKELNELKRTRLFEVPELSFKAVSTKTKISSPTAPEIKPPTFDIKEPTIPFTFSMPKIKMDLGFGEVKKAKKGRKAKKLKGRYAPSLLAVEFNIYGKMPKVISGVGIRPLVKKRKKKRKK